ncbi:MAG: hypothetical protein ACLQUY_19625 [Ktedonobacterales bacterium]
MAAISQNNHVGRSPVYGGYLREIFVGRVGDHSKLIQESQFSEYGRYRQIIDQAASILAAGEPDRAALLLDGLAQSMVMAWFAWCGRRPPEPMYLIAQLEEEMSPLVWWLCLALRAPDVEARLVHCRRLLEEIAEGMAL